MRVRRRCTTTQCWACGCMSCERRQRRRRWTTKRTRAWTPSAFVGRWTSRAPSGITSSTKLAGTGCVPLPAMPSCIMPCPVMSWRCAASTVYAHGGLLIWYGVLGGPLSVVFSWCSVGPLLSAYSRPVCTGRGPSTSAVQLRAGGDAEPLPLYALSSGTCTEDERPVFYRRDALSVCVKTLKEQQRACAAPGGEAWRGVVQGLAGEMRVVELYVS